MPRTGTGTRTLLQAAGLSLVFGSFLGDFVGGGAVVFADRIAVEIRLFAPQGGCRRRLCGPDHAGAECRSPRARNFPGAGRQISARGSIFLGHPATPDRVARINAIAPPQSGGARLLDAAEWKALKRICAGYR